MTLHFNNVDTGSAPISTDIPGADSARYARCIEASKRVRWTIEDVIKGREFDIAQNFLPSGFAMTDGFVMLNSDEKRYIGQIQGRTYANMFALLERFINVKILEVSQDHCLGDQVKLEALVRFSDEELKHQELFRRIETMIASAMPEGYQFTPQPNPVARVVLSKSTWSVLALTLMVELVTQTHYRESIAPEENLSPLYKDVFRYHWMEESQHATIDELELRREDAMMTHQNRDQAVDQLIELAVEIDGILQNQAVADAEYFAATTPRPHDAAEVVAIAAAMLKAYRQQYIFSGAENSRFINVMTELVSEEQMARIGAALETLN